MNPLRSSMTQRANKKGRGGLDARLPLFAVIFIALLALLVLMQGGYYADECAVFFGAFFLLAVARIVLDVRGGIPCCVSVPVSLLGVVGVFVAISGCVHGKDIVAALVSGCPWFTAAVAACAYANFSTKERAACRILLGWVGVVSAALGILMIFGIVAWPGSVSANRLNLTFQYANAAGVWFAICALVGVFSSSKSLRIASVLTIVALLLTRSIGTVGLFCVALVVLGAREFMHGDKATRRRIIICAFVGGLAMAGALVWFLVSGRIEQAEATFAERLLQMHDALVLFAQDPLWGVGPDGWRDAYEAIRSADYVSTVVHCSYLQVALDGGIFSLIALVVALVLSFIAALKHGEALAATVIAFVAFHALIDFDLRFEAILVLLVLFVVDPTVHFEPPKKERRRMRMR